jgi:hypothetical protein
MSSLICFLPAFKSQIFDLCYWLDSTYSVAQLCSGSHSSPTLSLLHKPDNLADYILSIGTSCWGMVLPTIECNNAFFTFPHLGVCLRHNFILIPFRVLPVPHYEVINTHHLGFHTWKWMISSHTLPINCFFHWIHSTAQVYISFPQITLPQHQRL